MSARCSVCEEPTQRVQPNDWIAPWGPPPEWSHLDGSSLCPTMVPGGVGPCEPEFV
jgi:hypothetical protein